MTNLTEYSVCDFGAKGDGITMDKEAIQAAIDTCTKNAGGTVFFPAGTYLTGALALKNNVTLHLAPEATLLGSTQLDDYILEGKGDEENYQPCLLYAENAKNIGLTGQGVIDGQGQTFPAVSREESQPTFQNIGSSGQHHSLDLATRPMLINFINCQNISMFDLHLRNSGSWCTQFVACDQVNLTGVKIHNRARPNNDGFDLESCRNVFISNCHIVSDDDAICLKSNIPHHPCENIVVTNCSISSYCAAVKFGTNSLAGFKNISISNCTFYDCAQGAIKLLLVDGGEMEDVVFSNITMHNVEGPIFIRLGDRKAAWHGGMGFEVENAPEAQEAVPVGTLRNVSFSNIRATVRYVEVADPMLRVGPDVGANGKTKTGILITGIPGHMIENINLSDVHITYPGGGTLEDAAITVPEDEAKYPEQWFFGVLPSYGAYVRHAKGVTFNNVRFDLAGHDLRPALICDDVEDLELSGFRATGHPEAEALIRLRQPRQVFVHGCRPLNNITTFLQVEGKGEEILLTANDMRKAQSEIKIIGEAQEE